MEEVKAADSQMAGRTTQKSAETLLEAVGSHNKGDVDTRSGGWEHSTRMVERTLPCCRLTRRDGRSTEQRAPAPVEECENTDTGHRLKRWKIRKQRENTKNTKGWECVARSSCELTSNITD